MKPPYDSEITTLLQSLVYSGLKHLKDTGKSKRWVNYEELCIEALGESDSMNLSEWHHYWNYWYEKFRAELTHTKRKKLFQELITDLYRKGFLEPQAPGLTGNITNIIEGIIRTEDTQG